MAVRRARRHPGGCLAASSGRHASGRPGESSARARRCCCATATRVRSWSSARHGETVHRTVRRRASIHPCRSPRPRPRAPHPRRTRTRRCPRRRRETWWPRRPRTPEGSCAPHPPRPRRSPTRHPDIVGKEKNARPSGRHTAWSLPSDDLSHLKRTKRSPFSVLCTSFSAPRSSTRRSREATWAPRDRSPRTSTSSRSGRTPTPRGTGCGSTSAFQTRGPARRFLST